MGNKKCVLCLGCAGEPETSVSLISALGIQFQRGVVTVFLLESVCSRALKSEVVLIAGAPLSLDRAVVVSVRGGSSLLPPLLSVVISSFQLAQSMVCSCWRPSKCFHAVTSNNEQAIKSVHVVTPQV